MEAKKIEELELDHLIHQENELQYKKGICHLAFQSVSSINFLSFLLPMQLVGLPLLLRR
jgi:hypothetical protein